MGLTLVRFEHASVNLEPFVRRHPFETSRFLLDCITKHYKEVNLLMLFSECLIIIDTAAS